MLEQMLANRRIEKNNETSKMQIENRNLHSELISGIEIWDWNQMLRSHNNLHLKWHTRSNMSVQKRKWPTNMDSDMATPKVLQQTARLAV